MRPRRLLSIVTPLTLCCLFVAACDTGLQDVGDPANLNLPDGIDPNNPRIERTTHHVDFDGVKTIRVDIHTGRVIISQSTDGSASLRVIETILADGHNRETLADFLNESGITAQRSFVDNARLDIKSVVAEGLAAKDISFDIRLVLPISASIEVFAASAPVEITNLNGSAEIQTAGGAIRLENINGNVIAKTSQHVIEARNVTGNLQASTNDAEIDLRLSPPNDSAVSAMTTNAAIKMTIANKTAAALDLATVGGVVSADLTGFAVSEITTGDGFLRCKLNGGGGRIEAVTTNAPIVFVGM